MVARQGIIKCVLHSALFISRSNFHETDAMIRFICFLMKKVLFITPYPTGSAPSQRFRFEQYYDFLKQNDVAITSAPFINNKLWNVLYDSGKFSTKAAGIIKGYFKRWFLIFSIRQYDVVFIHREVKPIGLPFLEWLICKLAKKVVFDFDDAIWLKNYSKSNKFFTFIKRYSNVKTLIRHADLVSCGNAYLANYAKERNTTIVLMPTTIDTVNYHNVFSDHTKSPPVIGWTGSHSTIRYLKQLEPVINRLELEHHFRFRVISDQDPDLNIKSLDFIQWNEINEIRDLSEINIGVMPLDDDQWAKGKCGFKALQYMSLKIPALVSPVGVNTKIVDHSINGIHCSSQEDWYNAIKSLLIDQERRQKMGDSARKKIEDYYSVKANQSIFLHLFD